MFLAFVTNAKSFGFDFTIFISIRITAKTNIEIDSIKLKVKHLSNDPPVGAIFSLKGPRIEFIIVSFGIAFNCKIPEI